jgi:hypothetical protein
MVKVNMFGADDRTVDEIGPVQANRTGALRVIRRTK